MESVEYFEVEGAVLREVAGKLEIYIGSGKFKPYTGDADRIYRMSHPMTADEVAPYTDGKMDPAPAKAAE